MAMMERYLTLAAVPGASGKFLFRGLVKTKVTSSRHRED